MIDWESPSARKSSVEALYGAVAKRQVGITSCVVVVFLPNSEFAVFPSTRPGRMSQSFDFLIFKRRNPNSNRLFKRSQVRPTR
jgi:hypothetical protein